LKVKFHSSQFPCLNARRVQRVEQPQERRNAEQQFNAKEFPDKAAEQGDKNTDYVVN